MNDQHLEACVKLIQNRCDAGQMDNKPFLLIGARMVTVKRTDGTYAKGTMDGDTPMTLTSAYVGKKGTPIFVFKPSVGLGPRAMDGKKVIRFVELGINEAKAHLTGFEPFWVEVTGDKSLAAMTDEAIMEQHDKDRLATYPNDTFGTW